MKEGGKFCAITEKDAWTRFCPSSDPPARPCNKHAHNALAHLEARQLHWRGYSVPRQLACCARGRHHHPGAGGQAVREAHARQGPQRRLGWSEEGLVATGTDEAGAAVAASYAAVVHLAHNAIERANRHHTGHLQADTGVGAGAGRVGLSIMAVWMAVATFNFLG